MNFLYLLPFVLFMLFINRINGHVILTFPLARPFALDGLDNIRSTGPCGMEYNKDHQVMTTLVSGTSFLVTWHVAYPHLGGVKLQILDVDGKLKSDLTDNKFIYTNDSTKLSHEVTLDSELECEHCVLRILREASEWSSGNNSESFLFWSCADVSIITETTAEEAGNCYDGRCLNGGICEEGECTCEDRFEGSRCEYENDCSGDDECGHGKCVGIKSSNYPRKICYCEAGWMGRFCKEKSDISEAVLKEGEEKDYFKVEIYEEPKFELFWKLIGEDEVEIALRVETDTWIAIGFRPDDLTLNCTKFPENTLPEPEVELNPNDEPSEDTADESARKRRKRFSKQFLSRSKREVIENLDEKENVIKQLCDEGNVAEAESWATWSFNQGLSNSEEGPVSDPETDEEAATGTETDSEQDLLSPSPEYHDKKGLHAMDCTDIIYATAQGDLHRIVDSYTRDRSTPQPDYWYGGKDDITAAASVRKDGILHVRFRRKLKSDDKSDYSIEDAPMRLIWARGQTPSLFHHKPFSGLEHCNASDYNFYKVNELKYHGTKPSQRGTLMFNFYDDPDNPSNSGSFSYPDSCESDECEYTAKWRHRPTTDKVHFQLEAVVGKEKWAAIGFSNNKKMADSDAVVGWIDSSDGKLILTDRWLTEKSVDGVAIDNGPTSLENSEGSYSDGKLKISFTRLKNTGDDNDLDLSECVYLLYAWGGGLNDGDLSKHTQTAVSEEKICIGANGSHITLSTIVLLTCLGSSVLLLDAS